MRAPEVARMAAVPSAIMARRAFQHDDAGARFARGQGRAQRRVAAAEHGAVEDLLLVVDGTHSRRIVPVIRLAPGLGSIVRSGAAPPGRPAPATAGRR